jgi:hypothetical protein
MELDRRLRRSPNKNEIERENEEPPGTCADPDGLSY